MRPRQAPFRRRRVTVVALAAALIGAVALALAVFLRPGPVRAPAGAAVPPPLTAPAAGLRVYHLGHSLVGRDMPAMLAQLAAAAGFAGHDWHAQLGWGATLRAHWEPGVEVAGFQAENDHPRFRPAREAVESGGYDALVLTEMVELNDAIRWHDAPAYLRRWAAAARAARPDMRVYLYETWHERGDPAAWRQRLDDDPAALWEGALMAPVRADPAAWPVHMIPAGRVLAALDRELERRGGVPGLPGIEALFAPGADGRRDPIHLNDQGHYLVALVHFAVLYHRAPAGLPHGLWRADGTPADPPSPEAADLMQALVWEVVRALPVTGLGGDPEEQ